MSDVGAQKTILLEECAKEFVLEYQKLEYSDHVSRIRSIESKASHVIAIAGIFLGAIIAYIISNKSSLTNDLSVFLALISLAVIAAIGVSIIIMYPSKICLTPGEKIITKFTDAATKWAVEDDTYLRLQKDIIHIWNQANNANIIIADKKAGKLFYAYWLLCGPIGLVVAVIFFKVCSLLK